MRRSRASVAVASVCTFFALLVGLSVQMQAGRDPVLHMAARPAIVRHQDGTRVVTRTSGSASPAGSARAGVAHRHAPLVTRASAGGGAGEDDE